MEKKFKVERRAWYGVQGAKTFYTFDEAKAELRNRIVCPDGVPHIVGLIESYAQEHYPENTPAAFGQLADIITKLLTDPNYPANPDDVELEGFRDDNIEFYIIDNTKEIYCYVDNNEYDGKFPCAEINMLQMEDEKAEYYFYLTQKADGMCWCWNMSLAPLGEEDVEEQEGFDFDDIEDDE